MGERLPSPFRFERITPNPARVASDAIQFRYALPAASDAWLRVVDVTGRARAELFRGRAPAGGHQLAWRARDASGAPLPPGVYWALLATRFGARAQKFVVIR